MTVADLWHADDDSYSCEALSHDIACWPSQKESGKLLRLEAMTQFHVHDRKQARERNLTRLELAQQYSSIQHLEVHHSCCTDLSTCRALQLLLAENREWISFTLKGINSLDHRAFYNHRSTCLNTLCDLFSALVSFQVINLHSCSVQHRGHGLEDIFKALPQELKDLRLHGWQMDLISMQSLVQSLAEHQSIKLLSLKSCLFLGEETFETLVECISNSMPNLHTVNLSYCSLRDNDIMHLVEKLFAQNQIQNLHLGGNHCTALDSVMLISNWLSSELCSLIDLNLRALWVGFSEEGLMQRFVSFEHLWQSLQVNSSLECLGLSENCLETSDIKALCHVLIGHPTLLHLDVGDNPFSEGGAIFLQDKLASRMESIRFENQYIDYKCAPILQFQPRLNYANKRLFNSGSEIPLKVWPRALLRIQQEFKGLLSPGIDFSPDIIFLMLHRTSGQFGHSLSYRIATQHHL
jgi:hypothetical protein